jgi:hypothetical protein
MCVLLYALITKQRKFPQSIYPPSYLPTVFLTITTFRYSQKRNLVVVVDDIAKEGAFDGKLDGLGGVFHVVSPFHYKVLSLPKPI